MESPNAHVKRAMLQLQAAIETARLQITYDSCNIRLAQYIARLEIVQGLCKAYCLDFSGSEWSLLGEDWQPAGVDFGSGTGNELAGSSSCSVPSEACAPERGRASLDELQGQYEQLSLQLDTDQ